jgi:hypothetical protein
MIAKPLVSKIVQKISFLCSKIEEIDLILIESFSAKIFEFLNDLL